MSHNYKLQQADLIPFLPVPRDYIEDYVGLELSRTGSACCPFHEDKDPTFSVSTTGFIKCFAGCFAGKGPIGIINFHRKYYHSALDSKTSYKNSLYDLASQYAPQLLPTDSNYKSTYVQNFTKKSTKKTKQQPIQAKISENRKVELFACILAYSEGKLSPLALDWLTGTSRALSEETIQHFRLFSIDSKEEFWQYITFLKTKGFSKEEIKATGIYIFLKFINYNLPFVIIPYFDIENRCTFLQARALIHVDKENGIFCAVNGVLLISSQKLKADKQAFKSGKTKSNSGHVPKYLNTRVGENSFVPLFNATALNNPVGKPNNRQETVTIFEGAFDCMLAWQMTEKTRCIANTSASNIQALLSHKSDLEPFFIVYAGDCDKAGEQRYVKADEKDETKLDKRCIAANFEIETQLRGRFVYYDLTDGYESFASQISYAATDFTEAIMKGIAPTFEPISQNESHQSILNVRKVLRTSEIQRATKVFDLEDAQTVDYQRVIDKNKRFMSDVCFSKKKRIPACKELTGLHYTTSVLSVKEKIEKQKKEIAQTFVYHTIIVDWFTLSVKIQNPTFLKLHEIGKADALASEQFSWVHKIDSFIKLEFLNGGTQRFSQRVNIWFQNELFARCVYKPVGILAKTNPMLMQITVENCFLYSCDWINKVEYIMQTLQLGYSNVSRLDIAIDSLDSLSVDNENSIVGYCNAYLQQYHKSTSAARLAKTNYQNARHEYANHFSKKPKLFHTTSNKLESLYFELYAIDSIRKVLSKKNVQLFDMQAELHDFLKKENRRGKAKRRNDLIARAEAKLKKHRNSFYRILDKANLNASEPAAESIVRKINVVKKLQRTWRHFDKVQPQKQMLGGNKMYYGSYKFDAERGYHEGVNVGGGSGKRANKTMKAYLKLREMSRESPHKMRYIPKFWKQNGLNWDADGEQEIHRLEISLRLQAIKDFGEIMLESENGEVKKMQAFDWKLLGDASYLACLFRTHCKKFFEFVRYDSEDSNKSRWERIPIINWDSLRGILLPKVKRTCPATIERALRSVKFMTRDFIFFNDKDLLPAIRNIIKRYDLNDYIEKRKDRWKKEFVKDAYLHGMLDYNAQTNEMISLNSTGGLIDPKRKNHLTKTSQAVDVTAFYLVGTEIMDDTIRMEYWCPNSEMYYLRILGDCLTATMNQSETMPYLEAKMIHNRQIKRGLLERFADHDAIELAALEKEIMSQPIEWANSKDGQTTLDEQIYFSRFEAKAMPKRPTGPAESEVNFELLNINDTDVKRLNPHDKDFEINF